MIANVYDKNTKEFLYEIEVEKSPLEKDVILMPPNATLLPIKETKENYTQIFNGLEWEYVEDYRGKTIWKSHYESMIVEKLGAIPNGWSLEQPELTEKEKAKIRQENFEANFFEIPAIEGIFKGGYYRKQPKGYQSAVESINTCFNAVTVMGLLPAEYLIFYTKPDFTDETQCTEEWLVANQFKNNTMTAQEFGQFYVAFMTAWNTQEHQ